MNMVEDASGDTLARLGREETIWAAAGVLRAWVKMCIHRHQICHVAQKRLNRAVPVVIVDSVFAPVVFSRHQFVLGATEWMKRMSYPETSRCASQTVCIR